MPQLLIVTTHQILKDQTRVLEEETYLRLSVLTRRIQEILILNLAEQVLLREIQVLMEEEQKLHQYQVRAEERLVFLVEENRLQQAEVGTQAHLTQTHLEVDIQEVQCLLGLLEVAVLQEALQEVVLQEVVDQDHQVLLEDNISKLTKQFKIAV